MASAGIAEERQVKRRTSEPCSDISGIEDVRRREVTTKIQSALKRKNERMEALMRRMKYMVTQTSEAVMKSVSNQVNDMNSMFKEVRKEGEVKSQKMDDTFTAMEAKKKKNWKTMKTELMRQPRM